MVMLPFMDAILPFSDAAFYGGGAGFYGCGAACHACDAVWHRDAPFFACDAAVYGGGAAFFSCDAAVYGGGADVYGAATDARRRHCGPHLRPCESELFWPSFVLSFFSLVFFLRGCSWRSRGGGIGHREDQCVGAGADATCPLVAAALLLHDANGPLPFT
eukprot:516819-Rhodomonas_salina.1